MNPAPTAEEAARRRADFDRRISAERDPARRAAWRTIRDRDQGEPVNDHDDMTAADVMSAAELHEADQRAEFAQDAADEARAAEEAAAEAAAPSDGQCEAEFIDDSWYGDDCPECRDAVARASDDCETCIQAAQDDDAEPCSLHGNGAW